MSSDDECTPCECNRQIDLQDASACDQSTGICLKCQNNRNGDHCESCVNGYFLELDECVGKFTLINTTYTADTALLVFLLGSRGP